jgi:photosystem II stability/assembly factor-like uncharacterized protein
MPRRFAPLALLALALFPAAAHAAPVGVAHAGWTWGNPLPQGDSLSALAFQGSRGYAVGEFGTMLRTNDGGATWTGVSTGLTEDLDTVRMISPDSVVVAGGCPVRRSDDGGKTFRRLPWTANDARCTAGVAGLAFPSSTVGYLLLHNGNLLRSSDSGRTWSRRTAVPGTPATSNASRVDPTDLVFTSTTTGFASTSSGDVFSTTDGGSTWTPSLSEPFTLNGLWFVSDQVGYAVGAAPVVLKTVNGGASWFETALPDGTPPLKTIRCSGADICLATTVAGDRLLQTTDGGGTWTRVNPSTERLRAVDLASAARAVAVGDAGTTVLSNDAGKTFTSLGGALPGAFTGVKAATAKVAYAYGEGGALARTINGGQSWSEIDAATSDDLQDVSYVSLKIGFALDAVGQLMRTDNAGDSWQILNTGSARAADAVVALDSKHVLLVGPLGARRSFDGGQSFRTVTDSDARRVPLGAVDHVGSNVIAYGSTRIVLSRDGGKTWRKVARPSKRLRIQDIDLVTQSTAFLLDQDGRLWRTQDSGKSWVERPATGTEVGYDISFADTRNGFLSVTEFGDDDHGFVLRTGDGGKTWEPQLLAQERLVDTGVWTPSAGVGFALTRANHLLATKTGGSAGTKSSLRISTPTPKLKKAGTVRIDGLLKGARGGEPVVVSFRQKNSTRWLFETVQAASNGTFTVVARLRSTARFVAQWAGDEDRRGAGTPVLKVTVGS